MARLEKSLRENFTKLAAPAAFLATATALSASTPIHADNKIFDVQEEVIKSCRTLVLENPNTLEVTVSPTKEKKIFRIGNFTTIRLDDNDNWYVPEGDSNFETDFRFMDLYSFIITDPQSPFERYEFRAVPQPPSKYPRNLFFFKGYCYPEA